ncbi:Nickel/cobalt efflux system RcnA [Ralstonia condita]|uniref:Nickel/cobalt efflux system n=1 Tax=Ralstonia condita TaxID=3058600 RepID=A0ABN9IXM2_9RALS|nr:nickel/cobalt efflux protein RcnA [Ralstonia sp. LMG 7141]CAJ0791826.1 Nickel/cobalt efflux system RcnA [Ralstonia sp. LMG 7141]
MTSFTTLLQQGNAWLFVPSAILLGALHGLEPGHSKTMMAAFIVAIRGTLTQAVLLGLSATVSHTAVVWAVAMAGLYFGRNWNAETTEPYFQVVSAVLIIGVAAWMVWRTWRSTHSHDHDHDHGHDHGHGHEALKLASGEYQDAHERAHADDIRRRFAHRDVTTGQIIVFGLTGGLMPCPASITVLLLCLQFKKITLGAALVLCFSIGLALTLVASGALAALSVKHVSRRWGGFGEFARRAPYLSGALITLVGVYVGWQGVAGLMRMA